MTEYVYNDKGEAVGRIGADNYVYGLLSGEKARLDGKTKKPVNPEALQAIREQIAFRLIEATGRAWKFGTMNDPGELPNIVDECADKALAKITAILQGEAK